MNAITALRSLLEGAHLVAKDDPVDAERRAKAVTALVRAERDVCELFAAEADHAEDDAEAQRAELLGRIARLVEADRAGAPDEVLERIASGVAAP